MSAKTLAATAKLNHDGRVLMLKQILLAGSAAALISFCVPIVAHAQQSNTNQPVPTQTVDAFMQQYNTGHDGKLSLEQANKAAAARFAILDTDHDGTVDQKEIVPAGLSSGEFEAVPAGSSRPWTLTATNSCRVPSI